MQLRRTIALTTAVLALSAPALSSCGFDYATDRYYTPGVGTNSRAGVVDVLSAVVVSTEPGSGVFIASLSNGSNTDEIAMTELGSTEGTDITAAGFKPIAVAPRALVNLADPPADLQVTGDFAAGDFVEVAVGFDNGERVVLNVPVVSNAGYYEGLDGAPAPVEETTSTPTEH